MEHTKINKITYNFDGGNIKEGSVFKEFVSIESQTNIYVNIINLNEDTVIPLPQFFEVEKHTNCLVGWVIEDARDSSKVYTVELYGSDLDSDLTNATVDGGITTVTLKAIYTTISNSFTLDKTNVTTVEKYQTNRKLSDTINIDGKDVHYFNKLENLQLILPKQKTVFLGLQVKGSTDIEKFGPIDFSGKTLDDMLKSLGTNTGWKDVIGKYGSAIIWSRNDNILQSHDIINHNDFILAQFFDDITVSLSVLPCIYSAKSNGIATSDDSDIAIAATNYGTTYVYSKSGNKIEFNSDNVVNTEAPNSVVKSNLGNKYIICAAPKTNCIFVGWYRRIITDGVANYSQIANAQQIEITIDSSPLCQYAAVFAKYGSVESKQKPIDFPNE